MFTQSYSNSFTITDARKIASKVKTDLIRIQRLYGNLTDKSIEDYEEELVQLIKLDVLKKATYGFKRSEKFIEPSVIYTSKDFSGMQGDGDDPGSIRPNKDISGAHFASFLEYNENWDKLTESEKSEIKDSLPINRSNGSLPQINGYLSNDKSYYSNGKGLGRESVKSI
jgi:hypothetical protein